MKRIKTKKQLAIYLDGKDPNTLYYDTDNYRQWEADIITSLQIHDKVKIGCEITISGIPVKEVLEIHKGEDRAIAVEEIHKGEDRAITIHKAINILSYAYNY